MTTAHTAHTAPARRRGRPIKKSGIVTSVTIKKSAAADTAECLLAGIRDSHTLFGVAWWLRAPILATADVVAIYLQEQAVKQELGAPERRRRVTALVAMALDLGLRDAVVRSAIRSAGDDERAEAESRRRRVVDGEAFAAAVAAAAAAGTRSCVEAFDLRTGHHCLTPTHIAVGGVWWCFDWRKHLVEEKGVPALCALGEPSPHALGASWGEYQDGRFCGTAYLRL